MHFRASQLQLAYLRHGRKARQVAGDLRAHEGKTDQIAKAAEILQLSADPCVREPQCFQVRQATERLEVARHQRASKVQKLHPLWQGAQGGQVAAEPPVVGQ